jgi:hypothetical protein
VTPRCSNQEYIQVAIRVLVTIGDMLISYHIVDRLLSTVVV